MKTMSARDAKNGFGLMIDTARAEQVLIEKHPGAALWWSSRWKNMNGFPSDPGARTRGRRKVANEAFARVKIDQLLKDANWPLTDGYSVCLLFDVSDGR